MKRLLNQLPYNCLERAIFLLGLGILFFLPLIESFNRSAGFSLLLLGSFLISIPYIWIHGITYRPKTLLLLSLLTVFPSQRPVQSLCPAVSLNFSAM